MKYELYKLLVKTVKAIRISHKLFLYWFFFLIFNSISNNLLFAMLCTALLLC